MKPIAITAVASWLLLAGCAEYQYLYQPAVNARASANGYPAAYYSIPANHPMGDVRVTSFGITEVQPQKNAAKMPTIQMRMIVANNSDPQPWTIDTREVLLSVSGVGRSRPAFVNTDAGAPPLIQIQKGQSHVIDLYYPLPPNHSSAAKIPGYDLVWQIKTGGGQVAERTPFEREKIDVYAENDYYYYGRYGYPYDYDYGIGLGFGPYWGYAPYYPRFGLYRGPVIVGRGPYRVYGAPHFHAPFYGHGYGYRGWGGYHGGWHGGGWHGGGPHMGGPHMGGPHGGGPHGGHR